MTRTARVLNQLPVPKQCWEAADLTICTTRVGKLLSVTRSTQSSAALGSSGKASASRLQTLSRGRAHRTILFTGWLTALCLFCTPSVPLLYPEGLLVNAITEVEDTKRCYLSKSAKHTLELMAAPGIRLPWSEDVVHDRRTSENFQTGEVQKMCFL